MTEDTWQQLEQARRHERVAVLDGMPCTLVHVCAYNTSGRASFGTLATLAEHVPALQKRVGDRLAVVGVAELPQLNVLAVLPVQLALLHSAFRQPDEWMLGMASVQRDHPTTVPVTPDAEACRGTLRFAEAHRGLADGLLGEAVMRQHAFEAIARLHDTVPATVRDAGALAELAMQRVAKYHDWTTRWQSAVLDALADYGQAVASCPGGMGRDHVVSWLKQRVRKVPDRQLVGRGTLASLRTSGKPEPDMGWPDIVEAGQAAMRLVHVMLSRPLAAFGRDGMTRMIHDLPRHLAQAFVFMGAAWPDIRRLGYWSRKRLLGAGVRGDDAPLAGSEPSVSLRLARWAHLACTSAERVPVPVAVGVGDGEVVFAPSRAKVQLPGPAWVRGALKALLGKED